MPTIREIAGLPSTPAKLSESALVLIDCQNTYREGVMQLEGVEEALEHARGLLERAREAGVPVFHIQHDAGPGSPYDLTAPCGQIAEPVAPREGEPVVVKNFPDSFASTDLGDRLQAAGCKNLVLAGFMSHMCVSSTARGGFDRGYAVTVVENTTATRELPDGHGGVISAHDVQRASLSGLADLVAIVVEDSGAIAD
ncbi:Streptothricin hydrolase [Pseudobythopirellula maris]|uniref:Streptothricin hydrolase n=1 Tax=Pseudobythopirellula maris TaxID=2527991 RepID=A0A5C5ZRP9_9BACT|nr:cysteine hydrolase family protein [Pseudobythopirellula maris]TWT90189.1 Streptothricin hydrolase [Pseudobythopirellula maris]